MKNNDTHSVPAILIALAKHLGTEVRCGRLDIPPKFGRGYCAGYLFDNRIRMMVCDYELKDDVAVDEMDMDPHRRVIFFKFQNIFHDERAMPQQPHPHTPPSVLIATSRANTDGAVSVHSNTSTINIEVDEAYLQELPVAPDRSPILQSLRMNTQPLLFEQIIYPSIRKIVDEIISVTAADSFRIFFLRIKAEELICRLLMELEKRDERRLYPLNDADIQSVYKVRDSMLANLDTPPVIDALAASANMSVTKLKRIFRQIFGDSIFSYYQTFRIMEAARLLREDNVSVADAGYRMGFTNLSHFARVFREINGVNPKEYTRMRKIPGQ
jgi:AraC-like DNA-binding protein